MTDQERIADLEARLEEAKSSYSERVAQMTAHRACGGYEHDPSIGKFHGNCVVCLVPFPCEFAGTTPSPLAALKERVIEAAYQLRRSGGGEYPDESIANAEESLFDALAALDSAQRKERD